MHAGHGVKGDAVHVHSISPGSPAAGLQRPIDAAILHLKQVVVSDVRISACCNVLWT